MGFKTHYRNWTICDNSPLWLSSRTRRQIWGLAEYLNAVRRSYLSTLNILGCGLVLGLFRFQVIDVVFVGMTSSILLRRVLRVLVIVWNIGVALTSPTYSEFWVLKLEFAHPLVVHRPLATVHMAIQISSPWLLYTTCYWHMPKLLTYITWSLRQVSTII